LLQLKKHAFLFNKRPQDEQRTTKTQYRRRWWGLNNQQPRSLYTESLNIKLFHLELIAFFKSQTPLSMAAAIGHYQRRAEFFKRTT
jgi:hypothetical protein